MEKQAALNSDQGKEASTVQEVVLPSEAKRVRLRIEAPEGIRLEVEIEAHLSDGSVFDRHHYVIGQAGASQFIPDWIRRLFTGMTGLARSIAGASEARISAWLFFTALTVYLVVRLVGLQSFPIYFFTDEAVQTNLAADLLRDGLRGPDNELLPTLFQNGSQYNLGVSVYLQVVPYFFFGKSIWATRAAAALATLLAAASVGLMLKKIFGIAYSWLAVLLLSITPVWFLHSRTAFETGLSVSFFAAFLYFYLRYRCDHPRYLYGAVAFAVLAFYSYSAARLVVPAAGLMLLISDWRYHWAQRRTVFRAFGLALLLAAPFVRFLINHPEASRWQMRLLGSVWITSAPFLDKISFSLVEYLKGLDPLYWYLPQEHDLPRHTMLGYGHLLRPTLPLALFGFGLALRNIRLPAYRTLIIAVLAAPAGAFVVRLGVTRALFMVIPAAVLTALGAAAAINWLTKRFSLSRQMLYGTAFLLLILTNGYMLYDSLVNGPLWYRGYSLTGMQYGARQVFGEIADILDQQPDAKIILSPSWANGTDVIARFFFTDPLPFELGSAAGYYSVARPLEKNQLFILIPEEFKDVPVNYFSEIKVEKILPYPDGQPGFYFVRLKYAENLQDLIAGEIAKRRQLVTESILVDGQPVIVQHTGLDMGEVKHIFDGDPNTLVRTWSMNPMLLDIQFPSPRSIQSLVLRVGGTATGIKIFVWQEGQEDPVEINRQLAEEALPRSVVCVLPSGAKISKIHLEISNTNDPADGHVHLWEITFQ